MRKRTLATVVLIASLFLYGGALFRCNWSFAESDRPEEGSIEFGAARNPAAGAAEKLGTFKTVFAEVAEEVVPTVVSVIPTKVDTVAFYRNPFYRFFDNPDRGGNPFDFFFGDPRRGRGQRGEPEVEKRERRRKGLGSGVIVSEEGYILTNYHVVSGADEIDVKLNDGRVFEAKIVGNDSLSDVAVIKIAEKAKNLPVAYLGDSDKLRPGDWAIAIGNPFSLTSSVTTGIVSALGRNVMGGQKYQNFIQTDAAINPGNSGGALVNIEGALIGINTMIYSRTGGYMGIGFAVPINMARDIMEDLIYEGKVIRGWIGVAIQDIDPATRDALDLGNRRGVLIGDVYDGQPAAKAGIQRGDIVLSIDEVEVGGANELRNLVATLDPGEKVPVVVLRDGKEKELSLKVGRRDQETLRKLAKKGQGEQDSPKEAEKLQERLGITVANLTARKRSEYGIPRRVKGVVVVEVNQEFIDASRVLKEGDVISEVKIKERGFRRVSSVKEFDKATAGLEGGDSVMFLIRRDGRSFFAAFKVKK